MPTLKAKIDGQWVELGQLPNGDQFVQKAGDNMTGNLIVPDGTNWKVVTQDGQSAITLDTPSGNMVLATPGIAYHDAGSSHQFRKSSAEATNVLKVDTLNQIVYALDSIVSVAHTPSWTPTLAGVAIGTGGANVAEARFLGMQSTASGNRGGLLAMWGEITLGTSGFTAPNSSTTVTLPPGYNISPYYSNVMAVGHVTALHGSTTAMGVTRPNGPTTLRLVNYSVSGTNIVTQAYSSTVPFTWAAGDQLEWSAVVPVIRV